MKKKTIFICPVCGSDRTDFMDGFDVHKESNTLVLECFCWGCKQHFTETLKVTPIKSEPHDYNPYDGPLGAPITYGTN